MHRELAIPLVRITSGLGAHPGEAKLSNPVPRRSRLRRPQPQHGDVVGRDLRKHAEQWGKPWLTFTAQAVLFSGSIAHPSSPK